MRKVRGWLAAGAAVALVSCGGARERSTSGHAEPTASGAGVEAGERGWRSFASDDGALLVGVHRGPAPGIAVFRRSTSVHGVPSFELLCEARGEAGDPCWPPREPRPLTLVSALDAATPAIVLDGVRHTLAPVEASREVIAAWRASDPFRAWALHVPDASHAQRVATDVDTLAAPLAAADLPPSQLLEALDRYADLASNACTPSASRTCGADEVRALLDEALQGLTRERDAGRTRGTLTYPFVASAPEGLYRLDPALPGLGRTLWLSVEPRGRGGRRTVELAILGTPDLEDGGDVFPLDGPLTEVRLPDDRSLRFEEASGAVRVRLLGHGWDDACGDAACPTDATVTHVDALEALGEGVWLLQDEDMTRPSAPGTLPRLFALVRAAERAAGQDPGRLDRLSGAERFGEAYAAILEVCGALPFAEEPLDALGQRGVCTEAELLSVVRDAFQLSDGTLAVDAHRARWGARAQEASAHRVVSEEEVDDPAAMAEESWGEEEEEDP